MQTSVFVLLIILWLSNLHSQAMMNECTKMNCNNPRCAGGRGWQDATTSNTSCGQVSRHHPSDQNYAVPGSDESLRHPLRTAHCHLHLRCQMKGRERQAAGSYTD
jgi:hypothetical protein